MERGSDAFWTLGGLPGHVTSVAESLNEEFVRAPNCKQWKLTPAAEAGKGFPKMNLSGSQNSCESCEETVLKANLQGGCPGPLYRIGCMRKLVPLWPPSPRGHRSQDFAASAPAASVDAVPVPGSPTSSVAEIAGEWASLQIQCQRRKTLRVTIY